MVISVFFCINTENVYGQVQSQNQSQNQQNNSWQYMGKVPLTKKDGSEWRSISSTGLLYSQFDGEKMIYKVYIPEDDYAYEVHYNPSYDEDKVNYEIKMNNKYDNWKGPHPKISESYPQKAGEWFLNVSNVW